ASTTNGRAGIGPRAWHTRPELRIPQRGELNSDGANCTTCFRSFGFELQKPCSAFTPWSARIRYTQTFSLPAHKQVLVFGHVTFVLQQLFQISLERGLCFNHRIERLLHLGRQIICIDVLPFQFFPCHIFSPPWSDEKGTLHAGPNGGLAHG